MANVLRNIIVETHYDFSMKCLPQDTSTGRCSLGRCRNFRRYDASRRKVTKAVPFMAMPGLDPILSSYFLQAMRWTALLLHTLLTEMLSLTIGQERETQQWTTQHSVTLRQNKHSLSLKFLFRIFLSPQQKYNKQKNQHQKWGYYND